MARHILNKRKSIVITFLVLSIISAVVQFGVPVQHDMVDYLPDDTPSIEATEIMDEEFGGEMVNTRGYDEEHQCPEALAFKDELERLTGFLKSRGSNDAIDMTTPFENGGSRYR
ncbi:hypothetical protein [Lentibacillus sp. CBA3610]|uniref:hypothetical protein n=1 Tax=Lentibacillus sp. CBA3610 TaxID=2518176 RepID=UPI0020D20DAE|nr:hypothetical protein [Lentibacillus sp. CBA3610]